MVCCGISRVVNLISVWKIWKIWKSGDETLHLMLDIVHEASKILNTFLTLRKKIALNSRATSFHRVVESEKLAPRISN